MTKPAPVRWHIGVATDPGIKRRDRPNEDSVSAYQSHFDPRPPLVVVADGMGGYKGGALASKVVVETFEREYKKAPTGLDIVMLLDRLVQAAHAELNRAAARDATLSNMGSTLVAAVLGFDRIGLVNVGDSRAYLLRKGQLRQISTDQSRLAELKQAGEISDAEATRHPERSYLTMSLTPKRKAVTAIFAEERVVEGDVLLLCSDGLWNTLTPAEMTAIVKDLDPGPAAEKLIALANTSHAADNVSAIVARLGQRAKLNDEDETGG